MTDTLIHAEKTALGFGQAELRNFLAGATGLVGDLPKTCGTWCGKRRTLARCSKTPEKVTCGECRRLAANEHDFWAAAAESLTGHAAAGDLDTTPADRSQLAEQAHYHRTMAARYHRQLPQPKTGGDS